MSQHQHNRHCRHQSNSSSTPPSTVSNMRSNSSSPSYLEGYDSTGQRFIAYEALPRERYQSQKTSSSSKSKNPFSSNFTNSEYSEQSTSASPYSVYGKKSSDDDGKFKMSKMGSYLPASTPEVSISSSSVASTRSSCSSVRSSCSTAPEYTCCLHGKRCTKAFMELTKKAEADESNSDDDSSIYETGNKYIKMKNISATDIAHSVSHESAVRPKLPQHHRRGALIPVDFENTPALGKPSGYESVRKGICRDAPPKSPARPPRKHHQKQKKDKAPGLDLDEILREDDPPTTPSRRTSFEDDEVFYPDGYETLAKNGKLSKPRVEKMKVASPYDTTLHRRYLGEMSAKEAEQRMTKDISFCVYHRLPSRIPTSYDDLPHEFSLYIVYRNAHGNCYHFPISGRKTQSFNGHNITQLTVEYGEPAPFFDSLTSLIKYYETYTMMDSKRKTTDMFPWWNCEPTSSAKKNKKKKQHRHRSTGSCCE